MRCRCTGPGLLSVPPSPQHPPMVPSPAPDAPPFSLTYQQRQRNTTLLRMTTPHSINCAPRLQPLQSVSMGYSRLVRLLPQSKWVTSLAFPLSSKQAEDRWDVSSFIRFTGQEKSIPLYYAIFSKKIAIFFRPNPPTFYQNGSFKSNFEYLTATSDKLTNRSNCFTNILKTSWLKMNR